MDIAGKVIEREISQEDHQKLIEEFIANVGEASMSRTGRLYGDSLYDLAAGEGMEEAIREQMEQIRELFRENPAYVKLLSQPVISPWRREKKLIEEAFGSQAERYLVNFLKLLCDRELLREYPECCRAFAARYDRDRGIVRAEAVSAVRLSEEADGSAAKEAGEVLRQAGETQPAPGIPACWEACGSRWKEKSLDGTVKGTACRASQRN